MTKTKKAVTAENYYLKNQEFMGASQYKDFTKCPALALARLKQDIATERSTALLIGAYVDAYFEGTFEEFKANNPKIYKKNGEPYAEFAKADEVIARIEKDEFMLIHLDGEKQTIMTGEISGVPFKIKMDVYKPFEMIVDLKIMKSFDWEFDTTIRKRVPFVEFWGYDIQGAVYQEIVRQNTGERLPFFIAGATKEKEVDIAVIEINQTQLDFRLGQVKENAPKFAKMKKGEEYATRCERCDYCKRTRVLKGYVQFNEVGI